MAFGRPVSARALFRVMHFSGSGGNWPEPQNRHLTRQRPKHCASFVRYRTDSRSPPP
jgi:hypothetical protein